ncbi:MAG: trimethylamine methyltransferase family protein [Candidatus Bathyarchaeota archaeon]|nr:MAG: trimethylamine methyltransferase family protein [Candidatus Bathyarchaeota archaeon]
MSENEITQIHDMSLKMLREIGVKVLSEKVQRLLADYGAKVDVSRSTVKIPSSLVEEAIKKTPKKIMLCGRDPKFDIELPAKGIPYVATSGFSSFTRDFETGDRRMSRSTDLRDFAILSDYLDEVDFFWPIVAPTDLPPPVQTVHGLAISFENTGKHVQYQALSEKEAKWQIKLAAAILGGERELRKRPIFSSINCSVSPLVLEKGSSEAMVELARAGVPGAPMSMALCGSTAPATIAGTLAMANTENLCSLVVLHCASPSAPVIYCVESTSADMRTGSINYQAPELPLIEAGAVQMARFYNLPCYAIGSGLASLSRYDITASLGSLEDAESAALEKLVLDAEALVDNRAYLRGFNVDDETLAFDAVQKVGHGGNFLGLRHTLEHFPKEIWVKKESTLLPSTNSHHIERAKEKVRQILSSHVPPPLDKEAKKKINQILRDCEKDML